MGKKSAQKDYQRHEKARRLLAQEGLLHERYFYGEIVEEVEKQVENFKKENGLMEQTTVIAYYNLCGKVVALLCW